MDADSTISKLRRSEHPEMKELRRMSTDARMAHASGKSSDNNRQTHVLAAIAAVKRHSKPSADG